MELDFSKPELLQTRDGRQVRIYSADAGGTRPVHGAVICGDAWSVRQWKLDGSHAGSRDCDLVPKPRRVTGWVNVYPNSVGSEPGGVFHTRKIASEHADSSCIGQAYIDTEVQV